MRRSGLEALHETLTRTADRVRADFETHARVDQQKCGAGSTQGAGEAMMLSESVLCFAALVAWVPAIVYGLRYYGSKTIDED
jgi:hypothetical protein